MPSSASCPATRCLARGELSFEGASAVHIMFACACMYVCPSICPCLSVDPSACAPLSRPPEAFPCRFTSGMTAGENLKIERRPMLGEISRLDVPAGGGDGKGSHGSGSKRVATHVKRKVDPVRVALLQQYDMWSKERFA
jgi:hypothetical protein